jgi:hypothetical protein
MSAGFVEFEFDLPEALLAGLTAKLTAMAGAPLVPGNLLAIPEAQGVYMLLYSCLCRARHKQLYAERRTMPSAFVFPRFRRDRYVIGSA